MARRADWGYGGKRGLGYEATIGAGLPGPCRLVRRSDGTWYGICRIQTSAGPLILTASCPEAPIRALVSAELRRAAARRPGAHVAGLFDSIGRYAKRVISKKIARALTRGYKAIARSPIAQAAVSTAMQAFGVPPMVSVTALRLSADLVDAADNGLNPHHHAARARIADIAQRAQGGEPAAVRALATLRAAQAVRQTERGGTAGRAPAGASSGRARGSSGAPRSAGGAAPRGARIVAVRPAAGGKHLIAVEVGGPVMDWLRQNWGYHRQMWPRASLNTARDAVLHGSTGYAGVAMKRLARRAA